MVMVGMMIAMALMAMNVGSRGVGMGQAAAAAKVVDPESVMGDISALPASVEMVIGLDDAGALRERPVGRAIERFLDSSGVWEDLSPSASGLAKELGLSERELFNTLLGKRVVLATRPTGSVREWVLQSRVSLETERRLRERLAASPRSIDAGHQVLSIERGAYVLVVHREAGKEFSTIVLAPGDRDGLMREIVLSYGGDTQRREGDGGRLGDLKSVRESLAHAADAFASTRQGGEQAQGVQAHGGLVVLARLEEGAVGAALGDIDAAPPSGEAKKSSAPPWSRLVALVGAGGSQRVAGDDRGWRCGVVVKQDGSGGVGDEARPVIAMSSDVLIRNLESDAVLAAVEMPGATALLQSFNFPRLDLLSMIPLPESAKSLMTGRRAFWVRVMPARERVVIGVAMETRARDELARSMDGAIARFVKSLEERFGTFDSPPVDIGGAAPEAVRVLPIRMPEGGVALISTEPLVASWGYPRGAEVRGAEQRQGWWALEVAQHAPGDTPSPEEGYVHDAHKLAGAQGEGAGVEGRWALLVSARPHELERVLSKAIPDVRGFRGVLRGLEEFRVRLRAGELGELVGDLSLRLAEPQEGVPVVR